MTRRVLAGTQGLRGHEKTDRLIEIADRNRLPLVLFAEGGGGRPGRHRRRDRRGPASDDLRQIRRAVRPGPRRSGSRPGAASPATPRCSAAATSIIATRGSNIGMGGPAMIEGGGLGRFTPEEIGPSDVQAANGVIDVLVEDEAEAVAAAKRYLSFFQGPLASFSAADPRLHARGRAGEPLARLRHARADAAAARHGTAMLELRAGFGRGIFTALGRIEGRPIGVIANNPAHLGGAIDVDAADKAARFLQLCNAHGLPIVSLVDTPGFMVGPEIEAQAQVRHVCRLFLAAAALRVPFFAIVVRKGYGLGAMGMTAGGFHPPDFIVAWPSGEFGGMGLEGAVRLGYRKELDAAPTPEAREGLFRTPARPAIRGGQRDQHGDDAGDRRRDRPRGQPRLARQGAGLDPGQGAEGGGGGRLVRLKFSRPALPFSRSFSIDPRSRRFRHPWRRGARHQKETRHGSDQTTRGRDA